MKNYAVRVNCRNTGKPGEFFNPNGRKTFSLLETSLSYVAKNAKQAAAKAKQYVSGCFCVFGDKPVEIKFDNVFFRVKERGTPRGEGVTIYQWRAL